MKGIAVDKKRRRTYQLPFMFREEEIWDQLPSRVQGETAALCVEILKERLQRKAEEDGSGEPQGHC
jgi:hypothetical protein